MLAWLAGPPAGPCVAAQQPLSPKLPLEGWVCACDKPQPSNRAAVDFIPFDLALWKILSSCRVVELDLILCRLGFTLFKWAYSFFPYFHVWF